MASTLMGALVAAAAMTSANGAPADPSVEHGRQLLAQYHCGRCHIIPGVAASRGLVAASLEAFGRRSYIAGRLANRPELLARWIADPSVLIPGTLMPDMGVSASDARDMAAYLSQLR